MPCDTETRELLIRPPHGSQGLDRPRDRRARITTVLYSLENSYELSCIFPRFTALTQATVPGEREKPADDSISSRLFSEPLVFNRSLPLSRLQVQGWSITVILQGDTE